VGGIFTPLILPEALAQARANSPRAGRKIYGWATPRLQPPSCLSPDWWIKAAITMDCPQRWIKQRIHLYPTAPFDSSSRGGYERVRNRPPQLCWPELAMAGNRKQCEFLADSSITS
jgi:hypothetical protein